MQALYSNTTGTNNTANGVQALYDLNITANDGSGNNTAIGYNTGRGIVTGVNNTILGANVTGLASNLSNNIIIADGAGNQRINVDASGNVGIGVTAPTYKLQVNGEPAANGYTAFTNYSDARLKENISVMSDGYLSKIMQLKPSLFNYNTLSGYDEETRKRTVYGFIAQDLQTIFPEMIGHTSINGTDYLDTNLSSLPIYLVKAMQEMYANFQTLLARVTGLEERIAEQEREIEELKNRMNILGTHTSPPVLTPISTTTASVSNSGDQSLTSSDNTIVPSSSQQNEISPLGVVTQ
jgi:hypothetical protein